MISTSEYSAIEIAKAVGGELIGNSVSVSDISTDSREKSNTGSCFFAIKGKNFDGNEYIKEAINNGAKIIVTNQKICTPVSIIYVKDTIKALGLLGKYHKKNTKIIGVTGSNGKTTTKDMIKSILKEKYSVLATESNNNNEIGVAKTLLSITDEEYCVVEMGMRNLGEIEWLSYISEPEISVITNALSSHIEILGSRENIFNAKCEILKHTAKIAILPSEERFKCIKLEKITPFFVGQKGDYIFDNITYVENGIDFDLLSKNINEKIHINSFGIHDVVNATFAYAVGEKCGLTREEMAAGLSKFRNSKLRNTVLKIGDIRIIEDCYNASYEGMRRAIISLCKYAENKFLTPYAIFGDMLEVGEFSKEYHYRIGEFAKEAGIKEIFAYGNFAKEYIKGFGGGIEFDDLEDATEKIKNMLSLGDVLLIKASRALHFEKITELLRGKYI